MPRTPRRLLPAWLGKGELLSLLGISLFAAVILGVTSTAVATFRQDIPLASVTQEIQLDLLRAQIGTFEVLAGDERAEAATDVAVPLADAATNCRALLNGGEAKSGRIEALADPGRRLIATDLCRDIDIYRGLSKTLLADPAANGEGTPFDERIDTLFADVIDSTGELSTVLDETIRRDAANVRLLGNSVTAAVVAFGVVITFLRSRQRRVIEAQTKQLASFGALVQSSGDAIMSLSPDGAITSWNPGAETLFGYPSDAAVGRHVSFLVAAEFRERFSEVWSPVSRGEPTRHVEFLGAREDGASVPLAITLSPILEGPAVVALSMIARDMSERTARDLQLSAARNEALEASRLKSQFLATMSHEIRTPLNGVLGLNELLLSTPLNEIQRQYAHGVDSAGSALLAVINDILDFSKLEAGKVELEVVSFDPRAMVDEVAAVLAVPAHTKGLELLAYCGPDVPVSLAGDSGRIRQILLNLASNAVKFTASGEVLIAIDLVTLVDDTATIHFEVRDTGIGLAPEGRQALFESFSQADASTTRRFGGTGLGLAISQRLVGAMGGEIGVDSAPGKGSTFWFSLPLPVAPQPPPVADSSRLDLLPGLRVLVVDDNATNRLILVTQLTAWRMLSDAVESGAAALSSLGSAAAAGQPYDIVVLDLLMPDMDGLELARLKRDDPALDHTRVILLTSSAHVPAQALAEAGIEQWCTKPVRTSALYDRLMRLMAKGAPLTAVTEGVSPAPSTSASRGRVLVAEDNEINQMVAEGILTMLGFEVEIVNDGAEACEALAHNTYAVVLMDCHMPVMDGFEATRQIRRSAADGTHTPIIAMTAAAMSEDRDRCLAAGMDSYVSKPITSQALDTVLSQWVVEHV